MIERATPFPEWCGSVSEYLSQYADSELQLLNGEWESGVALWERWATRWPVVTSSASSTDSNVITDFAPIFLLPWSEGDSANQYLVWQQQVEALSTVLGPMSADSSNPFAYFSSDSDYWVNPWNYSYSRTAGQWSSHVEAPSFGRSGLFPSKMTDTCVDRWAWSARQRDQHKRNVKKRSKK